MLTHALHSQFKTPFISLVCASNLLLNPRIFLAFFAQLFCDFFLSHTFVPSGEERLREIGVVYCVFVGGCWGKKKKHTTQDWYLSIFSTNRLSLSLLNIEVNRTAESWPANCVSVDKWEQKKKLDESRQTHTCTWCLCLSACVIDASLVVCLSTDVDGQG